MHLSISNDNLSGEVGGTETITSGKIPSFSFKYVSACFHDSNSGESSVANLDGLKKGLLHQTFVQLRKFQDSQWIQIPYRHFWQPSLDQWTKLLEVYRLSA